MHMVLRELSNVHTLFVLLRKLLQFHVTCLGKDSIIYYIYSPLLLLSFVYVLCYAVNDWRGV